MQRFLLAQYGIVSVIINHSSIKEVNTETHTDSTVYNISNLVFSANCIKKLK